MHTIIIMMMMIILGYTSLEEVKKNLQLITSKIIMMRRLVLLSTFKDVASSSGYI